MDSESPRGRDYRCRGFVCRMKSTGERLSSSAGDVNEMRPPKLMECNVKVTGPSIFLTRDTAE
jgi:hypothetical protein